MKSTSRSAFTLIELLVLFAVLAFLIGLLLPFIQWMRQQAALMQSQNNVKQIGLACHIYADSHKTFPPGVDANGYSTAVHLLPYIEQQNLFKQINLNVPVTNQNNAVFRKTRIQVLISPRDPVANSEEIGCTSYLFNAGKQYSLDKNNGVFFKNSKTWFPQITDGTSNTVMVAETLVGDGGTKPKTVQRQHVKLDVMALQNLMPNSGLMEFRNGTNIVGNRGSTWLEGSFLQTTFTGTRKLNDTRPDVDCGGAGGLSALRSLNRKFVVGICDGSVRVVNQDISMQTWQAACTRAGGEVLGADW